MKEYKTKLSEDRDYCTYDEGKLIRDPKMLEDKHGKLRVVKFSGVSITEENCADMHNYYICSSNFFGSEFEPPLGRLFLSDV